MRFPCLHRISLAACAAALGLAPTSALADLPPYAKVVTIAVVAPLSGTDKDTGIQLSAGVQAAVNDANELRGITDFGWVMHSFDDLDDPGVAQQQAQFALVDTSTAFVIGHVAGQATLLSLPTYHQAQVPVIVPTSPLAAITQQNYNNVFRLCPTDVNEGQQDARYAARTLKASRVAVLYEEDDYGVDGAQGFMNQAARGPMAAKDFAVDVQLKNIGGVAAAVKAFAPSLVFVAGRPDVMTRAIKALGAAGVAAPLLGTQAFADAGLLASLGSAAAGMTVSSCQPPIQLMPTSQIFVQRYQSQYGKLTSFALFGYVAGQVAIDAAQQTRTTDRATLDRALSVGTFQTVIGPISFQQNGDPANPYLYMYAYTANTLKYAGTASGIPNPLIVH